MADALGLLQHEARPAELAGMARFGIDVEQRLGLSMPAMRRVAKALGRDHALALALWETGIPDARIVASIVADPAWLTSRQMNVWVKGLRSWDVCGQVCGGAFLESPWAWKKVAAWSGWRDDFVRRAAFALFATLAVHDHDSADERFVRALALVEAAADDDRNFVRKAVNWALRNIGKCNAALNAAAIEAAKRIGQRGTRAARWIAGDALRELRNPALASALALTQRWPGSTDRGRTAPGPTANPLPGGGSYFAFGTRPIR